MRIAIAGVLLLAASVTVLAAEPKIGTFSSSYSIAWSGNALGEASITLTALPEADCYRYETQTKPVALVRWLYGSPRETSQFCVREGVIRPSHFEYRNDKREKDNFTLDFDWTTRKLKALKRGVLTERDLPETAYDRFVLQLAVRRWVQLHVGKESPPPTEFHMADDDRIVVYKFMLVGNEVLETPAGKFETVRLERVDNPKKSLRIWLAPSRDYTPVKIEQIEEGEVKLRMLLK